MLSYPGDNLGCQQRVPPQIKEIVVNAHSANTQYFLPDLCQINFGISARVNIFFLSVGDPDRIMLIRTSNATSGVEIAEDARTRFMEKTRGRRNFGLGKADCLTASFSVIWSRDTKGDRKKLHQDALKLLEEAKDSGKNCVKEDVFTP